MTGRGGPARGGDRGLCPASASLPRAWPGSLRSPRPDIAASGPGRPGCRLLLKEKSPGPPGAAERCPRQPGLGERSRR